MIAMKNAFLLWSTILFVFISGVFLDKSVSISEEVVVMNQSIILDNITSQPIVATIITSQPLSNETRTVIVSIIVLLILSTIIYIAALWYLLQGVRGFPQDNDDKQKPPQPQQQKQQTSTGESSKTNTSSNKQTSLLQPPSTPMSATPSRATSVEFEKPT